MVEAADASHISELPAAKNQARLASPPSLMRKKTRTIIALTISWELFMTKEKKKNKQKMCDNSEYKKCNLELVFLLEV